MCFWWKDVARLHGSLLKTDLSEAAQRKSSAKALIIGRLAQPPEMANAHRLFET
jgi:hypothetical protein